MTQVEWDSLDWLLFVSGIVASVVANAVVLFIWHKLYSKAQARELARVESLAKRRAGYERDQFVKYFLDRNVPREMIDVVYAIFRDFMPIKDFPVQPHDNIKKVYRMDGEYLWFDSGIATWIDKWGLDTRAADSKDQRPIETVEDLVMYLASCPKRKKRTRGITSRRD